jgi:aryl-alcohol dehydrogenase-like predicted oxidoreductase
MQRKLGPFEVAPIGLGCMNLSHAYGAPPPPAEAERVLLRALELGVVHFDTAALYGFGANEELVGRVLRPRRESVVLASKCGMTGVDGKRVIDGRPETIRRTCEESLRRLQTDVIDLYYLHRWDKRVALEESVGALGDLVAAGKVRAIGLSEVSAASLRKAHAVHPIAAVQSEYSLFTRNPELGVLDACKELGAALVAFSPLSRGLLAGTVNGVYEPGDIRRTMPRFNAPHLDANLALARAFKSLARDAATTPAQLALAWLLDKHAHIIPIPGTTSLNHLEENLSASSVRLTADLRRRLEDLINAETVRGARYAEVVQREIDTEEFA